ncbi:Zinc finger matrin-type protein 5 [Frankliniella fusca]|uniref:Zinc finger matrin-type protein 5 n=1 Tax=Frankliniella fusca TaxID=407009 RepID=A0AAE1HFL2_9NEOP|nr:Zinc finger matrin-type protein 5 [Frankliniella fusca]
MDKNNDSIKPYRAAVEDDWPRPPVVVAGAGPRTNSLTKTRCTFPVMPALSTYSSNRVSRPRRPYFSHPQDHLFSDTSFAFDFRTYHLHRQFSEDSGFSSCGSSASSLADDLETCGRPFAKSPALSNWSKSNSGWRNSSQNCRLQSGTVASVLAAGVSDSEETDFCESDDEGSDGVFDSLLVIGKNKVKGSRFSSTGTCEVSSVTQFSQDVYYQNDSIQLKHCGRNILDLGTNLRTQFPLKATQLPEKNLPSFLQNRSQYHRLGTFGTVEELCFANCIKQCGFTFPIPSD